MSMTIKIGNSTLYLGDCLEVLPTLKAAAVISDPPYGIAHKPQKGRSRPSGSRKMGRSNTWHAESVWDAEINDRWLAAVCLAAPIVAWFGHWRMRQTVEKGMLMPIRAEIVWAKNCHVGPPAPTAPRDERIWLFSNSGIKPSRFETSVWDEPLIPTWKIKEHVNEKPVRLMSRLVSWLQPDSVIDPFMGSGTTGVACADLGIPFIGIEIDPIHFEKSCERIDQAHKQQRLLA